MEFRLIFFGTAKKNFIIKTGEIFSFLPLINNSVTVGFKVFTTKHINNHIIKNDQYFSLLIWILLFNFFVNIIHVIQVFHKSFRTIKML